MVVTLGHISHICGNWRAKRRRRSGARGARCSHDGEPNGGCCATTELTSSVLTATNTIAKATDEHPCRITAVVIIDESRPSGCPPHQSQFYYGSLVLVTRSTFTYEC